MIILTHLLAWLATAAGLLLLYLSWRRLFAGATWPRVAGWALLSLAGVAWCLDSGPEFGAVYAVSVPSLGALGLIVWHWRSSPPRNSRNSSGERPVLAGSGMAGSAAWRRHGSLFLLAVPFAAVCTTLITMALGMLLPWSTLSGMVFITLAAPAIWGLAASWICADDRLWRPVLVLALGAGLALLPILMLP